MTSIFLYAAPGSCARVTMTALEHIGLPFEYRLVRMMKKETKTPEYLAINPKGKVPVLGIDGEILTENVAILRYLNERFPDAGLFPPANSLAEKAQQLADLCFCAATLHPIVTRIRNPHFFADSEDAIHQVFEKAVAAIKPNFEIVERRLKGGNWWYGAQWSAVDAYLYWVWFRSGDAKFSSSHYPAFAEFSERMEALDAVKKMLAREVAAESQLRLDGLIK